MKVLVLPRVINHIPEFLKEEVQKIEPLDNSMYSTSERVLLAWLNFHYKNQRERLLRDPGNFRINHTILILSLYKTPIE